jgi:hypothetical protein
MGDFGKDFVAAIGVAAGATIGLLIVVCLSAHFGPRLCCGVGKRERWLATDVENTGAYNNGGGPLMAMPDDKLGSYH